MANRTFGWIQDAGKLSNLKRIVYDFIQYGRMDSLASQQIISDSLGIGRWANETYLRLCEALGFVEYDREYDDFVITDLGRELSQSNKDDEKNILTEALLSYPPACRVLQLLRDSSEPLTKFEIAQKLGFVGESGFLTIGLNHYIEMYHNSKDKNKIKSNKESTLDKYARMIASYLMELGLVQKATKKLKYHSFEAQTPHTYQITERGIQAYMKTLGKSTSKKIYKNVSYEMLASRSQIGNEILRTRRALILDILNQKKNKLLSYEKINEYLLKNNSNISSGDFIANSSRQMNDYIYTFVNKLQDEYKINRSYYHWVSSKYIGNRDIEDFAENIKNMYSFESKGSIISISNALLIADRIQIYRDFKKLESLIGVQREILQKDIEILF